MRARPTITLLCLAALPACRLFVEPAGERAARGAITAVEERVPEGQAGRQLARNSAIGFLDGLTQPEQLQQLRRAMAVASAGFIEGAATPAADPYACRRTPRPHWSRVQLRLCAGAPSQPDTPIQDLAEQAAEAFVNTFTRKLVAQLGKSGQGPLADSVTATAERVSAATAKGVRSELGNLFPECRGPDRPQCIERRLQALGKAASSGVAAGLTESVASSDGSRVDSLTQNLVASFSRELINQLGPEGEGPLAKSLAATTEMMASSAMRGVRIEIAPDCAEAGDQRCFERRLEALGRATSSGIGEGLADSFGWVPMLVGFIGGLVAAIFGFLVVHVAVGRRRRPQPI